MINITYLYIYYIHKYLNIHIFSIKKLNILYNKYLIFYGNRTWTRKWMHKIPKPSQLLAQPKIFRNPDSIKNFRNSRPDFPNYSNYSIIKILLEPVQLFFFSNILKSIQSKFMECNSSPANRIEKRRSIKKIKGQLTLAQDNNNREVVARIPC